MFVLSERFSKTLCFHLRSCSMGRESSGITYANLEIREMLECSGKKKYVINNSQSEGRRCLESESPSLEDLS